VTFTAGINLDDRRVILLLDGEPMRDWDGGVLALPFAEAGYHTITLQLEPSCPGHPVPVLGCRAVLLNDMTLTDFTPEPFTAPVQFERGVQLLGDALVTQEKSLAVQLWWGFDAPLDENTVRFVHVLDAEGDVAAQNDQPYTGARVEQINFDALAPGTYDIYTGWYTLPDVTRLAVQTNLPEAVNGWVHLGQVEVNTTPTWPPPSQWGRWSPQEIGGGT
jgi:hypothetical protein